ncbi:MAG: DUF393 domain-containing protein [Bacteroidetes bacterium]|nr:DUF393 domain-containing protein [Bacteroidota bacterium]
MRQLKTYSAYQFSFFRIILGVYLFIHFVMLFPYAVEMWSNAGLMPDASLNLTHGFFPNILNSSDSPFAVQLLVLLLIVCSLLFTFGIQRPIAAFVLWYGWVCLFDRNNLISNPGLPFIGWILLCCIVVPKGEPLSLFTKKNENWSFPPILFWGAWIIMSVGYTISGFDKLHSPSWRDGSAIIHLLNNPLARDWGLRTFFLSFPQGILHFLTWGILLLEMTFLPFAIWKKTRMWIWLFTIIMHAGILLIVDFADLTFGMLMIHWFTFDGSWIKPIKVSEQNNFVFFDGVCGLCNSFVDFLLKEDKDEVLLYAPLQGETAPVYLNNIDTSDLKTVVFFSDGKVFTRSDAIIEILKSMGGIWGLAPVLRIFPRVLRDYVYSVISKNRIKWFGQKETCRMPTEKERGRLWR